MIGWICTAATTCYNLFACQFAIEAAERNGESLQRAQWISKVHGEYILRRASKLHHNVFRIGIVHQLEILHRRLGNTAVKVQHIRLGVVVPDGRFVVQFHDVVQILGRGHRGTVVCSCAAHAKRYENVHQFCLNDYLFVMLSSISFKVYLVHHE